ncbi:glycosyltransferase [Bordetella sp. 02P26C-1]|uniref:glycosyltransferase n=1 Tax=Bordetella sp. 02P26C-1 TaxID=2683195 RepID=UPI0013522870|nr:glycosyltransferase [Bordetella sp. 02P26C-1]MVW80524.1 glycosyltransferase [Bordetella sp. 02P26C-1]
MLFFRRKRKLTSIDDAVSQIVRQSDLFDAGWYLRQYPDVADAGFDPAVHYVRHGAAEQRRPGPWFDPETYIHAIGSDEATANPLLHYIQHRPFVAGPAASVPKPYTNLSEYLIFSLLCPIVRAPFTEEDRRCFAAMENIKNCLVNRLTDHTILVSVIMPVRNRDSTLRRAAVSVLTQSYLNLELIIIDDGSEDQSVAVASELACVDSRVRHVVLTEHVGVCAARNIGLKEARGDIIAYLDSDNIWLSDFLAASIASLNDHTEIDAVYSGQYLYDSIHAKAPFAIRFGAMNESLLEQHNYIDLNCLVHRRRVLDAGVRFDENLQRLVDWDFILQIKASGRICSVPFVQSNYYAASVANSITSTVPFQPAYDYVCHKWTGASSSAKATLARRVCVVIPSFEALEHLRRCVDSLQPYLSQELFELVIVDNNSSDEVKEFVTSLRHPNVKVILNDVNYGFSYAVNQGVAVASRDADVLLLNNDAELETDALTILQQTAYHDDEIAISVPRQVVPAGTANMRDHVPYADLQRECDVSLSAHHRNISDISLFHEGRLVELNFAPFFCVYIKRPVWDSCGGLDYANGRHYRSDRIMCDLVRNMFRKRIVYVANAKVRHAAQAATRELQRSSAAVSEDFKIMFVQNRWPDQLRAALNIVELPWMSS